MTDLVKEARKRGWTTDIERHTALMMLGGEEPAGTRTLVRDVIDRLCAERDRMEGVAIRLAAALSDADAAGFARGIEEAARVAEMHATQLKGASAIAESYEYRACFYCGGTALSSGAERIRALLASQEQQT